MMATQWRASTIRFVNAPLRRTRNAERIFERQTQRREVGWRSKFVAILFYSRPLTYILHPIYIGMVTHFTFGT